jgi:TPR repeat protein
MALFALAMLGDAPPEKGMEFLKLAHEGTVLLAAAEISRRYADGDGVPRDMAEALRWLKLGVDQGDPWANTELGRMYWEGNEDYAIKKDWEQALFHFALAVRLFEENGYTESIEVKRPMLYRANLSRRLPMEKVAEIWDRAQSWKPTRTSPSQSQIDSKSS